MHPPANESGGTRKGTAAVNAPSQAKPDVLRELSNWLRSQFLRHDVLFKALGSESDKLAAVRFARFVDALDQARGELLPPWLDGNELLALASKTKKEAKPCR